MPFVKGQPRPANAGRRKGTPNKITRETAIQLAEIGLNPVVAMAKLAMDLATPIGIRAHLLAELQEYVHAKRRRIEVGGPPGLDGEMTPAELRIVYVNKPYADRATVAASEANNGNPTIETL